MASVIGNAASGAVNGVINILAGSSIKVTPEQLVEKSSEVLTEVDRMSVHFDELKALVDKTETYWVGEAGDLNRKMYADMIDEIEEILRRLHEHPRDLVEIANKYSETELKIEEEINSLPQDVLI